MKSNQSNSNSITHEVPLTASGQYDESGSADIDHVQWSSVRATRHLSSTGLRANGVVVVDLAKQSSVVVKSSMEPAREMFLTRLCRHLGVAAPSMRFVHRGTAEYAQMLRATHVVERPVLCLQDFVKGVTLEQLTTQHAQLYFRSTSKQSSPVLRALGRIMGLDVFFNNWDRVPLIHDNRGNFGNVILQDGGAEGRLVAIDNAMTGIRSQIGGGKPNPQYQVLSS